ncbi:MAG: hypothetical protein H0W40_10765 [Methylibium sp.]|uniref:hypothetical protein n=1 Tax=Methylibium sp. TaxID=2067992 RepID=UPI00181F6074|nr:hypothetical protein [Methylibium sp.]MBA3597841.1 hypothetical protein [Methylibium sp.]
MKRIAAIVLSICGAASAIAETNVGVSIGINQPGVYGRIDIGSFPQPAVIYSQPILIAPQPMAIRHQPAYLYVPPEHQKNWAKHCGRYGACAQPVYFVQESWVRERYQEQQHRGHGNDHGKKEKKEKKHKG